MALVKFGFIDSLQCLQKARASPFFDFLFFFMLSSRGSSRPGDGTRVSYVSCIGRQVLYH